MQFTITGKLLLFTVIFCVSSGHQKCTESTHSYDNYLGTKTPYRIVANRNSSQLTYPGCQAVKLWGLVRHGTRNPNLPLIERMRGRLPEIRNLILENFPHATENMKNVDLDLFKKWVSKLEDKDEKKLTREGDDEMLLLAERLQNRFPKVLDNIYSDSSYKFKFTATQRTKKSAQSFATGLFGKNTVRDINFPEPLKKDPILRFYKLCNKWRKEVSKNPAAILERKKFEGSQTMKTTISNINRRLGFTNQLDLTDIHTMYMVCAFETAWNKRRGSPWCSPFTIEDFKVMEYAEDLKYFWVDGYGHELTYKQACPAFNDMIDFLENEEKYPKATVYFTHSGTLLKMLAHMELYKDTVNLTADHYSQNGNRKWRVSRIDPFGTNLVFVLFKCEDGDQLLTMHQENVVRLPSCPDSDLCALKTVKKYYGESVDACAFNQMCDNDETN